MTPRQIRMVGVAALLLCLSCAAALILYALNRNINLFFTPSDVLPIGTTIRLGGIVVPNSIDRSPDDLIVQFALENKQRQVQIIYEGILPDLFREGQAAVAVGKMVKNNIFHASQILAKHDENYIPRDLTERLDMPIGKMP